jgi:hypothetical protein
LLEHREMLSLDRARILLGTRARVISPLGASEFLGSVAAHDRLTYDKRVRLALDVCEIYRERFPDDYAASLSPDFSTSREQEFYRLVHDNLFPLRLSEDTDLWQQIEDEPNFFLPFIPVKGIQRHMWAGGCFNFQEIETCFKVAQVLSWYTGAGGRGWEALSLMFGLPKDPSPAPPLNGWGWSHFLHSCRVDESPIRYLPLAFHFISYKTGNVWLDLPQIGYVGFEWSPEKVSELAEGIVQVREMEAKINDLNAWLDADPAARISRSVELWNRASEIEAASEYRDVNFPEIPGGLVFDLLRQGE